MRKQIGGVWLLMMLLPPLLLCRSAQGQTSYSGIVRTPDGKPAAGAVVRLLYCHEKTGFGAAWLGQAQADAEGRFTVTQAAHQPPGIVLQTDIVRRYCLVATQAGWGFGCSAIRPGEGGGYEVRLSRGRRVVVTVKDKDGIAVQDARVHLVSLAQIPEGAFPEEMSDWLDAVCLVAHAKRTNADGVAVLDEAPECTVRVEGFHPRYGKAAAVAPLGTERIELSLNPAAHHVQGKVVDALSNKPIEGMVVTGEFPRLGDWCMGHWCLTQKDGTFAVFTDKGNPRVFVETPMALPHIRILDPRPDPEYAMQVVWLDEQNPGESEVRMERGSSLVGQVLTSDDRKPVPSALVEVRTYMVYDYCYYIAGQDGRFRARMTDYATFLERKFGWATYTDAFPVKVVSVGGARFSAVQQQYKYTDRPSLVELPVTITPSLTLELLVENPDGAPATGALAESWNFEDPDRTACVRADGRGRVQLRDVAKGRAVNAYIVAPNGRAAAVVDFPPPPDKSPEPRRVRLKPAWAGEVALVNVRDKTPVLNAKANVILRDAQGRVKPNLVALRPIATDQGHIFRVQGLLPDTTYLVACSANGYIQEPNEAKVWPIPRDKPPDRMTRTLKAQAPPGQEAAFAQRKLFDEAQSSKKTAIWEAPDPVEKHLTWRLEPEGLVLADANANQVTRFTAILGREKFAIRAIAFAPRHVWLATDIGLLGWGRNLKVWRRVPVADLPETSEATNVVAQEGTLRVTMRPPNQPEAVFESSDDGASWKRTP